MRDSCIQAGFQAACREAKEAEGWYCCLMVETSRYGGPEEGGWWVHDRDLVAYQHFPTEEQARAAAEAAEQFAKDLEAEARRAHGNLCGHQLDWLEARGLEPDWLPEVDGPDEYSIVVCKSLPEPVRGPRHYE